MNFSEKMEEMRKCITTEDIKKVRRSIEHFKNLHVDLYQGGDWGLFLLAKHVSDAILSVRRSLEFQIYTMKHIQKDRKSMFKIVEETPDFWNGKINLKYTENINENMVNCIKDIVYLMVSTNPLIEKKIRDGVLSSRERCEIEEYFF